MDGRTTPATVHPLGYRPEADSGPGRFVCALLTRMDVNHETSIFDSKQLRAALERLDLADIAKHTLELAEDYMPGAAWLDSQGKVHFAETMSQVDGLVLCQATEVDPDSPDEVPFWVASWIDEFYPDIADRLRIALAEATWGTASAPEVD